MESMKLNELIEQTVAKLHERVYDSESLNRWKTQMFHFINEITELKLPSSMSVSQDNSSLDPIDWVSARSVAHEMLNSSLDYIQYVRDHPVCRSIPSDVRAAIEDEPLPEKGQSLVSVCRDTLTCVVSGARGTVHPRYWGWVSGEGTLGGVIADMIGATLNINAYTTTRSSAFVERTVIEWMRQVFAFPADTAGGLLVSGTSIATVISMATARRRAIANVRNDGLANGPQLVAYASTETHLCVKKALELIGIGSKALHFVPVDDHFRIKIDDLKAAIQNDRNNGLVPFCIVGNAGKFSR
jgi:aromatic-L-amino-acid decarboxylase